MDTLWNPAASVATVNRITAVLLVAGLAAIVAVAVRAVHRGEAVLAPTAAAALLWFFATTKLYSAQYALWIMLALALAAAPVWAASVFVATDVLVFITLWGGLPAIGDFDRRARQIVTAGLAALTTATPRQRRAAAPRRRRGAAEGAKTEAVLRQPGLLFGAVPPDSPIWSKAGQPPRSGGSSRGPPARPRTSWRWGRTALDGPVENRPGHKVQRRRTAPCGRSLPQARCRGYDPIAVAEPTSLWPRAARRSA